MTQFISRAYNSFSVDHLKSVIKKTSKETRLSDETSFYKGVPESLSVYFPRLISSGLDKDTYFLSLELYPYLNLGKYLTGEAHLTPDQWTAVAKHIFSILMDFSRTNNFDITKEEFLVSQKSMYYDKTEREYNALISKYADFAMLSKEKTIVINGKSYLNFEETWSQVKTKYADKLINKSVTACVVHGDCCFSNILLGLFPDNPQENIIKFVDPRGKFGSLTVFGDRYYDLAKLAHSTEGGYEYFIYDQFEVKQLSSSQFILTYKNDDNKKMIHDIFTKEIYSNFDRTRIKIIQGLIYVGMCARHYDSQQRQLAMYLTGVRLLNEALVEGKD